MKKIFTILLLFAMTLTILFVVSCSDGSSGGISINPLTDDMKKCAPDLASSVINEWSGWSGAADYGVLRKHFDSTSKGENIYAPVELFDDKLDYFSGLFSSSSSAAVTGPVSLPDIFGGTAVNDFETRVEVDQYIFYYKPAGTDGTEKFLFYWDQDPGIQNSLYAIRNNKSNDLEIWTAGFNTASENKSHAIMHFEGNTVDKNFKFRIKTDAGSSYGAGWAFWGGGSIKTEDSYIAVRGTNDADSANLENDGEGITGAGTDTTYVILKVGEMKAAAGPVVKDGTAANFNNESDATKPSVKYIDFGTDCLHKTLGNAQNFKYPTAASELLIQ